MVKLLGYEIDASITQNQVQQIMVKIMHNTEQMKAILEALGQNGDAAIPQLNKDVLSALQQEFANDSSKFLSEFSPEARELFSKEVKRLSDCYSPASSASPSIASSPHSLHGSDCGCRSLDFARAIAGHHAP